MGSRKPSTGPKFPRAGDARLTASAAKPEFPGALPQYWNVPVRNRLFTGREDVLEKLHRELERDRRAALTGLGGIGKTQTAIEYAHRYRNDYNAVFFIRTDTETALIAGLVEIAGVLALRLAGDHGRRVGSHRLVSPYQSLDPLDCCFFDWDRFRGLFACVDIAPT